MKEGDVVLTPLPQADGEIKPRPALLLRRLPPFGDFLTCGITSKLERAVRGFDDVIRRSDADFGPSGLIADSVIRLGFLAVLPRSRIVGSIGTVSSSRHHRLLVRLSRHLTEDVPEAS